MINVIKSNDYHQDVKTNDRQRTKCDDKLNQNDHDFDLNFDIYRDINKNKSGGIYKNKNRNKYEEKNNFGDLDDLDDLDQLQNEINMDNSNQYNDSNNSYNYNKYGYHSSFDQPELRAINSKTQNKKNNQDRMTMTSKYKYSNPYESQSRRLYDNYPPTVQNNLRTYPMKNNRPLKEPTIHDSRINEIIGGLDSYSSKINKTYQYGNEMDNDFKIVKPSINSKNKNYMNTATYKPVPHFGRGDGQRDISIETAITRGKRQTTRRYNTNNTDDIDELDQEYLEQNSGLPERGSKSIGYTNPVEHYYDYISDDIQDPDHVVFDRGTPTRMINHGIARNKPKIKTREIMQ